MLEPVVNIPMIIPDKAFPGGLGNEVFPSDLFSKERIEAWQNALNSSFPTVKDEDWRWTDFKDFPPAVFAVEHREPAVQPRIIETVGSEEIVGSLKIDDSAVRFFLKEELQQQGLVFTDLANALQNEELAKNLVIGKVVNGSEDKFSGMAAALAKKGVVLQVPDGMVIEQPLFSSIQLTDEAGVEATRVLIHIGKFASAKMILDFTGGSSGESLHTGIVEVLLEEGAQLKFSELQETDSSLWQVTRERALIQKDAKLEWTYGALGTHQSKNFVSVDLTESGAEAHLYGFYFAGSGQRLDLDTQQNHLAVHTTSNLLFRGAANGRGQATWEGMIYVDPVAQQTDAYQSNRNLMLSEKAEINTIPGLEILANDVRCSHGATVGKLDEDELFYLQCRGIPRAEAEELMVEAFFSSILDLVPVETVRHHLMDKIKQKFNAERRG